MYSLPFLKNRLPKKYYKNWGLFIKAVKLCQKRIITHDNLSKIQSCLLNFYTYYEREYYCGLAECLSIMRICIHYMLHISESIFQIGPYYTTW